LLFALVFTIFITIKFIPAERFLFEQSSKVANYFPEELAITIKDGNVSTNVQEPYFIKLPEDLKASVENKQSDVSNIENIAVINTKDKFDIDTFVSYKTFMLLTSDSVVYMNSNNQITINSLTSVKNFTLNRSVIVNFINKIKPLLVFLYPLVFVGGYIVGFMSVVAYLVYLLFGALIIWLVVKVKKIDIGYKKSYQIGMHLVTSVIIINGILSMLPMKNTIPFLSTILLILLAILNLKKDTTKAVDKALDTF
jgi:hypothetical protein